MRRVSWTEVRVGDLLVGQWIDRTDGVGGAEYQAFEPPCVVTLIDPTDSSVPFKGYYQGDGWSRSVRWLNINPKNGDSLLVGIREFPGTCIKCRGPAYVGLRSVVHEDGREECP